MTIKPRHPEKVNKPINPIKKKPEWIRSKLTNSKEFFLIGFTGLLTFSGCLGLIVIILNYIKGLVFFAKQKFFSN